MGRLYATRLVFAKATQDTQALVARKIVDWANANPNFGLALTLDVKPGAELKEEDGRAALSFSWLSADAGSITVFEGRHKDKDDASRTWRVRSTTALKDGELEFFLELWTEDEGIAMGAAAEPSQPRIVPQIVEELGKSSPGALLLLKPQIVREANARGFVQDVLMAKRQLPVLVVSPRVDGLPIDPARLARKCIGLAYVYVIESREAGLSFTRALHDALAKENLNRDNWALAKRLVCFDGAARIYWPAFNLHSHPFDHELFFPSRTMANDIFARLTLAAVASLTNPSFDKLKGAIIQSRIAVKQTAQTVSKERDQLKAEVLDLRERVENMRAERDHYKAFADSLHGQLIEAMKADASSSPGTLSEDADVSEALELARANHPHVLDVHPAARRSARESRSPLADDVYRALSALARVGARYFESDGNLGTPIDKAFEEESTVKGKMKITLHETPIAMSGDYLRDRQFTYGDTIIDVEPHITLAAGDRQRCVEIRFILDDKRQRVVIFNCGEHARGKSGK